MIRVRLFGGFEVWHGDRQVRGFESQKVRALFVYLACQSGRAFSRDHLAGLLWPEQEEDGARHALRQALYNLRSALPGRDSSNPPLLVSHGDIRINPAAGLWVDVHAFEESIKRGASRDAADPHHLATAVQLYRGDFLAGFFVRDSSSFEEWLIAEQERLREATVEALRALIESYRRRGEYRFGLHYARRLVALEPLAEEPRRNLMRFYAMTGRRSQALAEYEDLVALLDRELGVDPLAETRELYESIRDDAPTQGIPIADGEPIGPIIPLAGRRGAWDRLRDSWRRTLSGETPVTVVEGETGIGKTRLIRTFLDAVSGSRRIVVLRGAGHPTVLPTPFLPWLDLLRGAFDEAAEGAGPDPAALSQEKFADLVRLLPELGPRRPELPPPPLLKRAAERRRMFETVIDYLGAFCSAGIGMATVPLVIFLDDLHLVDDDSLELLQLAITRLHGRPCWFLLATEPTAGQRPYFSAMIEAAERVEIRRFDDAAIEEIAVSLVGDDRASELSRWLAERSRGLPFAIAELINLLWDEGLLTPGDNGIWQLGSSLSTAIVPTSGDLGALLGERVRRLPSSIRRLAIQASFAGWSFEAELLQRAADEHPAVVEIGLELLLKRWLIRQSIRYWSTFGRASDVVLWKRGARRGSFEFAHQQVREALASSVLPARQRALHARVASTLETLAADHLESHSEELAGHYLAAEMWGRALPYLERAEARARGLLARSAAMRYATAAAEAHLQLAAEKTRTNDSTEPNSTERAEAAADRRSER
ncbi:MAG TPA: BTAD domain-containing putative transcriptional regulator [Thermoanaerobaculia bacterium]|nr:BTAD domain-containing putative transcriptional regulator [Thermoanaerobaculia bacterium]